MLIYPLTVIVLTVLLHSVEAFFFKIFNYGTNPTCRSALTFRGVSSLKCSVTVLSKKKMASLVPPKVTQKQYLAYWGLNSKERLQRVLECVLFAYGGAWLAWFSNFMAGPFVSSIIGCLTICNWMYNPWLYARRRNSKVWSKKRPMFYAIYSARIKNLSRVKRRAGKSIGGVAQQYLEMVLEDEGGRRLDVVTQWQESYRELRMDMLCESVICAPVPDFSTVSMVTDMWVPSCDVWVGDYPYLDRELFVQTVAQEAKQFTRGGTRTAQQQQQQRVQESRGIGLEDLSSAAQKTPVR